MYIDKTKRCEYSDGTHILRSWYLILMQPEWHSEDGSLSAWNARYPIKAVLRKVALRQFGQWMMGRARIRSHSIIISGSYGHDGLPCAVPIAAYNQGIEVPAELIAKWNTGGGWNSAGSEAPEMAAWAHVHFDKLVPLEARQPEPRGPNQPQGEIIKTWRHGPCRIDVYDLQGWKNGRSRLGYRLRCGGITIFEGVDYSPSPMHAEDSLWVVADLLRWFSLRPGDTDEEYFANYTPTQLAFAEQHGEELSYVAINMEERLAKKSRQQKVLA